VKVIVFNEGILVESPRHSTEFVKNLEINGTVVRAKIHGHNMKSTKFEGYYILKANAIDVRINGWLCNVTTSIKEYVFGQIKPRLRGLQIKDSLTISGGIKNLEVIVNLNLCLEI